MISDSLLEQILLNLGDKAPWLLVFLIFVRFMWPDIVKMVAAWVEYQKVCAEQPDQVALKLDHLATNVATLVTSLNMFFGEYRTYALPHQMSPVPVAQPPVSPTSAGAGVASDVSGVVKNG